VSRDGEVYIGKL